MLLEEPYSYDGRFAGTGHAAIYLPRICADTPVTLRRCQPGEDGVVISRYDDIAGYDWLAIPLIPYLYAVEEPEAVPLLVDAKTVAFLRDQYRRRYLRPIAPDATNGAIPNGPWVQLVGSAYDRTLYGFSIETTEEQDDALIRELNAAPNIGRFHLVTRNCSDFVRAVISFYYPKAIHRAVIGDLGVTTPKQVAKSLVKYGKHHPEVRLSSFVIPQVPGSVPRSRSIHGVLESAVRAKKYMLPLMLLHPIATGTVAVPLLAMTRFDPQRGARVREPDGGLEVSLTKAGRKAYERRLKTLTKSIGDSTAKRDNTQWKRLQESSTPNLDAAGKPVLDVDSGRKKLWLGLSRENILESPAPRGLAVNVILCRLQAELRKDSRRKVSKSVVEEDWNTLTALLSTSQPGTLSSEEQPSRPSPATGRD
jgi:hypothetical protein